MKITKVAIRNIVGAREIDFQPQAPITLLCGFNHAGKSSINEAVRMAFSGEGVRVAPIKKNGALLISDGAKSGSVYVETDAGSAMCVLPSAEHELTGSLATGLPAALPYVLDAQRFAKLTPEQRRTFLFGLTGCNVTTKEVKKRLLERGCNEAKVDAVLALLRNGFPSTAAEAEKKSTEAKGSWRALTKETYGKNKAATWTAPVPEIEADTDELLASLQNAEVALATAQQDLGAQQQKRKTAQQQQEKISNARAAAERLPRIEAKLAADQTTLAEVEEQLQIAQQQAGEAPRVGAVHEMARILDKLLGVIDTTDGSIDAHGDITFWPDMDWTDNARAIYAGYVAMHGEPGGAGDPEARARIPELTRARDTTKRAIENDQRDIAAAHAAKELLTTLEAPAAGEFVDVAHQQDVVADLVAKRDAARTELDKHNAKVTAASRADEITKEALQHHTDVAEWAAIGEALAPEGIPTEMLAQALTPVNRALRDGSIATSWAQPNINLDMSITADGRLYQLLSESEQWRVDAIIAAAIAKLSGQRILLLDRMDVLDLPSRIQLLMWLDQMADTGDIESAIICATLKAMPGGLPPTIEAVWLENGAMASQQDDVAAAA